MFRREPALIVGVVSAALSLAVTFGIGLTSEQAGAITAAVSALFAAVAAAFTRPIAPAAFTGVVAAATALTASFGFELSAEAVGGLNALVLAVLALLTRGQVSPTKTTDLAVLARGGGGA